MKTRRSSWRLRSPIPDDRGRLLGVGSIGLVLAAWCVCSYVQVGGAPLVSPFFLPPPHEVIRGLIWAETQRSPPIHQDILISVGRVGLALLLSIAVAFPLGIAMGAFDAVNRFVDPVMAPMRYLPITAFIPLLILWVGINESFKIVFLFLGTFVFLLPVVVDAIRSVPEELVQTSYTLGASKWQTIRTVLIPAALPQIFDSFRVMNAIAWTYIILAEIVNATTGLGRFLQDAATHTKPAWSFGGIIVVGFIGLLTDLLIRGANHVLFRWREADA